MTVIERILTAPDGRTLQALEAGDPAGVPVLMFHGSPGSGLIFSDLDERSAARGIRIVSYARPGYAGSTRREGRNVADAAGDVRAVAAGLGIRRLAVWGISGGGPHAAACAALLDGLVGAVATLGSPALYGAPRLDYFGGMGEDNVEDIRLYFDDPAAARAKGQQEREDLLAADIDGMRDGMTSLLAPVDADRLNSPLGAFLLADMQRGLAPGDEGWWDDGVAHLGDWGFGLTQIRTPVLVVHGAHDRFVPVAHGEWLAAAIPGAEARILPDEGHLSLYGPPLDAVHDWLLARV